VKVVALASAVVGLIAVWAFPSSTNAQTARADAARTYKNAELRVRAFTPPAAWELAPQAAYPRVLATWTRNDGSGARLTLSAQRVPASTTPSALVDEARAGLTRQGFQQIRITPDGARVRLEATLDGGRRIARQAYLVEAQIAYVVTVVGPGGLAERLATELDDSLRSLQLGE
jgi:hypothetical protein